MGAHPYWYVVEFKPDIDSALQELRQREFQAGRYNPVIRFLEFPQGSNPPTPGARHSSIQDAINATDANGTRSILDLDRISDEPDSGAVSPIPDDVLLSLYGTTQPTRQMVEAINGSFDDVERGQGVYIILYKDGQPDEIYFAGYSYD